LGARPGGPVADRIRQPVKRGQRLGQGGLARRIERQRQDRGQCLKPVLISGVIGRGQDQIGPRQLQQFEIRGAAQAQIGDAIGQFRFDRIGAKSDQLAGGDGHVADGDGGFQHRPVDGGQPGRQGRGTGTRAQRQTRRQHHAGGGQKGATIQPQGGGVCHHL
jgi:hypothetical protein